MEILFDTPEGACIENVRVSWCRTVYLGQTPCVPGIDAPTGFPVCGMFTGKVATETLEGVDEVTVTPTPAESGSNGEASCPSISCSPAPCAPAPRLTAPTGNYNFSCTACTTCNFVRLKPEKDDNPLNGVTTYDPVLISKHILGTEPFDSPYKMIAADANKSGSITTFDIVELRKLILGIYDVLPNNTSWCFVDKSHQFPNMGNPFQSAFPEAINCVSFPSSGADFVAVKVGDVNNTAQAHRPSPRPEASLSWPSLRAAPGSAVTVPVTYTGDVPMEAVQLGLRFDPSALRFIGASQGDIESWLPGNFNLLRADKGEIKALWLPMTGDGEKILPGTVLFYLSFEALADVPEGGLPLSLDPGLLDCAAWSLDGTEHALRQGTAVSKRAAPEGSSGLRASVFPNPSTGVASFEVESDRPEKARLMLFDGFGRRMAFREFSLAPGKRQFGLPDAERLPQGVYVWKLLTPTREAQGHLILTGR